MNSAVASAARRWATGGIGGSPMGFHGGIGGPPMGFHGGIGGPPMGPARFAPVTVQRRAAAGTHGRAAHATMPLGLIGQRPMPPCRGGSWARTPALRFPAELTTGVSDALVPGSGGYQFVIQAFWFR